MTIYIVPIYNVYSKSRERRNEMTNTSKRTTKANREVECKASQYRLHAAALEVLRQTPGFLTYPEAVVLAKAGKRTGW